MADLQHLQRVASQVRRDIIRQTHYCNSGHPGGSLGCADLLTALYFGVMQHDPDNFTLEAEGEDVFFLSNGHISPVFYSVLARSGYFPPVELSTFRRIDSRLQGHPTTHEGLPGVRIASGSLGQGPSVAIGMALSKKLRGDDRYVFCLTGDGELQEGQIWEACMFAPAKKVDNLILIVDRNHQQIDGPTHEVLDLGSVDAKLEAFGWDVMTMNGNDMAEVVDKLGEAKSRCGQGQPVAIVMTTTMGHGVDFMAGTHKWHGKATDAEQTERALGQLEETLGDYPYEPDYRAPDFHGHAQPAAPSDGESPALSLDQLKAVGKKSTRDGFGAGLHEVGQRNAKVVALCADLIGSLKMQALIDEFPDRFFQVGIAEANMMGIAAGLATGGFVPYTGTFANFSTGRVYDQIRQSIAYSNKNVKICASHAGLTLGEDGATHQILEDTGMMKMLPGMTVINPCDYNQTKAATIAIADHEGPVYLRFGRPGWPVFIPEDQPFEIGKALHLNGGTDVTILATGHLTWYAVEAARELAGEGISVDLLNIHTIKPLDEAAILASARKTGRVVVAEEHMRNGGLGESVAGLLARELPTPMRMVAVSDRFGESGTPADLLPKYGLSKDDIVRDAKGLCAV